MKKWTLIVILQFLFINVWAKTDVDKKLDQMKTNAENSEHNLGQYKDNLSIVDGNLDSVDKALGVLKNQEKQLNLGKKQIDENKKFLDQQKIKIKKLIISEETNITAESKQIEALKEALMKLEDNKLKRQENVQAYNDRLLEIDREKEEWGLQKKYISELRLQIGNKLKDANSERKKWSAKQSTYKGEVSKWAKQARSSRDNHNRYRGLSNE